MNLPREVVRIGTPAFFSCFALEDLTLPAGVTEIGRSSVTYSNDDYILYCYPDSAAHQYAVDNKIRFSLIEGRWGDGDRDETATSADARLALQIAVAKIGKNAVEQAPVPDVDGDGRVTSTDARLILQKSVNKISSFPVQDQ